MEISENPCYSRDYMDPEKRSIANAVQVFFADGSKTEKIAMEYPLGHKKRRAESIPFLQAKFDGALDAVFPAPDGRQSTLCLPMKLVFAKHRCVILSLYSPPTNVPKPLPLI